MKNLKFLTAQLVVLCVVALACSTGQTVDASAEEDCGLGRDVIAEPGTLLTDLTSSLIVTSFNSGAPVVGEDEFGSPLIEVKDYQVYRSGDTDIALDGPLELSLDRWTVQALERDGYSGPVALDVIPAPHPRVRNVFVLDGDRLVLPSLCEDLSMFAQSQIDSAVQEYRSGGGNGDLFEALAGPVTEILNKPVDAEPFEFKDPTILSENGKALEMWVAFESDHKNPVVLCFSQGESDPVGPDLFCSVEGSAGGNVISMSMTVDYSQDLILTVRDAPSSRDIGDIIATLTLDPSSVHEPGREDDDGKPLRALVLNDGKLSLSS